MVAQKESLELGDDYLINRGRVRVCYRHPADPKLVVKVAAGPNKMQRTANLKELKGYRDLVKRHGELPCVGRCHGIVQTSRGDGLVCDCICNADGTIAETIWDMIIFHDDCDVEKIVEVARVFCSFLVENDIFLFDLNLKNIALPKDADGGYRAVSLDLKGRFDNNEFIPFSSYITFFARRKLRRRTRQLLERIVSFRSRRHDIRKRLHL